MRKYIYGIRGYILLQILCDVVSTTALAFMPYLTKLLFDSIGKFDFALLARLICAYVGCVIVSLVFTYVHQILSWKGAIKFEKAIKRDFFKAVCNYSYQRFKSRDVGEYIALQSNEITELEMDYLNPILDILQTIISVVIYGVILFVYVDWRVGLVILSVSMFGAVFAPNVGANSMSARRKTYLDQKATYFSKIKDYLEGFKLVKPDTRPAFYREHEVVLEKTAEKRYHFGKLKALLGVVRGLFLYLVYIAAFAIVGYLMFLREITIGAGVAAFGYIECFVSPIQSLIADFSAIKSTKDIKKKVMEFLKYDTTPDLQILETFDRSIDFKHVSIKYDHFILDDFTYSFKKGKKYALIGHNGSGKSTIINALMKYTDIQNGEIAVDGVRNELLDTSRIIWCVSQHEHIFCTNFTANATIFSSYPIMNLDFLRSIVGAHKMRKIDSQNDGQLLSGGEKQLIGIARALAAENPVIILDESFSALDATTSMKMSEVLLRMEDKTVISVTHKIGDHLYMYDEVLLIGDGKILTSGPWKSIAGHETIQLMKHAAK